jgi:hypothetical protein
VLHEDHNETVARSHRWQNLQPLAGDSIGQLRCGCDRRRLGYYACGENSFQFSVAGMRHPVWSGGASTVAKPLNSPADIRRSQLMVCEALFISGRVAIFYLDIHCFPAKPVRLPDQRRLDEILVGRPANTAFGRIAIVACRDLLDIAVR